MLILVRDKSNINQKMVSLLVLINIPFKEAQYQEPKASQYITNQIYESVAKSKVPFKIGKLSLSKIHKPKRVHI